MQPFSRNQRPDLPTALMNMSLVLPATENAALQILFKCPTLPSFFGHARKPSAHFWQGAESLAPTTQNDASTSKSGANMWCFVHFDFEMCFAPQRRALLLLNISISKSALNVVCFVQFDLAMCFAPQWCALFQHLNFQKCSEPVSF